MKAKFLALAALILGMVSCQTNFVDGVEVDANGEAAVTLQVGLPEDVTRAVTYGNSGIGAIGNLDLTNDWDIRYILEVYDSNGVLAKTRIVNREDENTETTFSLRLIPGRKYRFVVWADFIPETQVGEGDYHYNTNDIHRILLNNAQLLNDESRDAYTGIKDVDNFKSSSSIALTLKRPFAKLRVVTTDMAHLYTQLVSSKVVYTSKIYTQFNAYSSEKIEESKISGLEKTVVYSDYDYAETGDKTLFADYFFGSEDDRVMFTLDVTDNTSYDIPTVNFNTNIPVNRNHLTTVKGNILTDANNITVTIEENFANSDDTTKKPWYVEIISGVKTQAMDLTEGSYLFEDVTFNVEDAAAIVVKSGNNVVMDLMGVMNINAKAGIVVEDGATLTINGVGVADTRGAVRAGYLVINASEGSAIGGNNITINNLAGLTAKANGNLAFGIGSADATVNIENTKIDYVCGGHVQALFVNDASYGKSEPEGGAAIGGAKVVIKNSTVTKAEGGSKAAAIGNRYWANTEVVIENSQLGDIFGGNASAAIGGSRVNSEVSADNNQVAKVKIVNSTITNAVGGQFGAGIGSGYDTHCAANETNTVNEIIIEKSNITAQGGKYAAGIGTGFHTAALTGSIDAESVIKATSGETFYKKSYTTAQNVGYAVIDPTREGKDLNVTFTVAGKAINIPTLPILGAGDTVISGLGKDYINEDNYYISEPDALYYITEQVNGGNEEYIDATINLSNDIDLLMYATRSTSSNWTPIGTVDYPFTGTFDGNGYTIKNLTIVETEAKEGKAYIGFFGYAEDATIMNVVFENVNINIPCLDIDHSQGHIGAVAGSLEGTSTIENVTVKGDIKVYATQSANGASRVAVIAGGNAYGDVTMKNVHVIANEGSSLIANNNTGALAGQLQGKMYFENCSSNIDVTVNKFFAGGLVGIAAGDSYIKNCHTTGDVAVVAGREGRHNDEYRVGGIAGGWADGKTKVCTLEGCTYTGKVSGKNSDGTVADPLDYAGYVGRGYTLSNCAGSTVIIDGVKYIQVYDNIYGVYTDAAGYEYVAAGYELVADGLWKKEKTYVVSNANGLVALSSQPIAGGETVTLGADIDLAGVEFNGLDTFHPENNNTFDGQNFTVSNWTNNSKASDMGFIRNWVGTIKNVKFENCHLQTSGRSAIVGAKVYGNIENVTVNNCSVVDSYWACGIVAGLYNAGNISNCTVTNSSVKSNGGTGVIVGVINESAGTRKVENCKVEGCTVNNTGAYGEAYSGALVCGMINISNSTVSFVGNTYENNTKEGKYVGDLYYAAGEDITVVVE